MSNFIEQFKYEMELAGILPPENIIMDAKIHRFSTNGSSQDDAGWYVFFNSSLPAGAFGDWRSGVEKKWRGNIGRALTQDEKRQYSEQNKIIKQQRELEKRERLNQVIKKANFIWGQAKPASENHPYLVKKAIPVFGAKEYKNCIVLPLKNENQDIHSLQFINIDGKKKFLTDSEVNSLHYIIGLIDYPKVICIAEGFATGVSIHQATGYPVVIAFYANNLLAVSKIISIKYPNVSIVLCADDDLNQGIEKAKQAALFIKGILAIPEFEKDRPKNAKDFNDVATLYGIEKVQSTIKKALEKNNSNLAGVIDGWGEPISFWDSTKQESYPIEVFPEIIRNAIIEVQACTQAPLALVASSALGMVSLVGQSFIDVERACNLKGPVSLFLLTIADSGERKSTCDNYFSKAVREYERQCTLDAKEPFAHFQAALTVSQAAIEGIKQKIKNASREGKEFLELTSLLKDLELNKPKKPKIPRLIYNDITTEALKYNLCETWPSAGIITSEGGSVFGAHSMQKDYATSNFSTYNEGWDGKSVPTDRRTSESLANQAIRLTIAIQTQETILKEFNNKLGATARGIGFFARVLFSNPASTQGTRFFKEIPEKLVHLEAFNERVRNILNYPIKFDEFDQLVTKTLTLAPLAKLAWKDIYDSIEKELDMDGDLFEIRDVASKMAENIARIAALFHFFEFGLDGEISESTLLSAGLLASWYLNEAKNFFENIFIPIKTEDGIFLEKWLINYCSKQSTDYIEFSKILQYGPKKFRKKQPLGEVLEFLENCSRVRVNKNVNPHRVEINPKLLKKEN